MKKANKKQKIFMKLFLKVKQYRPLAPYRFANLTRYGANGP